MAKNRGRQHRSGTVPIFLLLAAVCLVWALYGAVVFFFPFRGEFWDARGKFGDMYGAFNALFTACAFAALIYGIRLEYKAFRRQELHSALSAQLDTLVDLYARPAAEREPVWRAIVTVPGGPGEGFPIEQAIAVQIESMDRLLAGEDLEAVPTYGLTHRS